MSWFLTVSSFSAVQHLERVNKAQTQRIACIQSRGLCSTPSWHLQRQDTFSELPRSELSLSYGFCRRSWWELVTQCSKIKLMLGHLCRQWLQQAFHDYLYKYIFIFHISHRQSHSTSFKLTKLELLGDKADAELWSSESVFHRRRTLPFTGQWGNTANTADTETAATTRIRVLSVMVRSKLDQ